MLLLLIRPPAVEYAFGNAILPPQYPTVLSLALSTAFAGFRADWSLCFLLGLATCHSTHLSNQVEQHFPEVPSSDPMRNVLLPTSRLPFFRIIPFLKRLPMEKSTRLFQDLIGPLHGGGSKTVFLFFTFCADRSFWGTL